MNGNSLRSVLEEHCGSGGNLSALTVLSPGNDPYRVDTPGGHRDGSWLATSLADLGIVNPTHLRGLHYILTTHEVITPDGVPYTNTDADWVWLGKAAKSARWLRYVPFDQITDQRNEEPTVRRALAPNPQSFVTVDLEVVIPDAEDLQPTVGLRGFTPAQPYRIVMIGEKSSLRPALAPIADRYDCDLYLPTGEISDTQIWMMARDAAEDGRPMVVLYFADCDPAGWQMAISVSRKLQALRDLEFGDLDLEMHRVTLVPDQVLEYDLPSTPLKDTEMRADKWTAAMHVRQTEIDALVALRPDLLDSLARDAIAPFYDSSLDRRARQASAEWRDAAQQAINDQTDVEQMDRLRADAATRLDELRARIDEVLAEVDIDVDQFDLPDLPALPDAVLTGVQPEALLNSRDDFRDQCRRLIESKAYTNGASE